MPKADSLLVEVLVEELPPKLLDEIASQFAQSLADRLQAGRFAGEEFGSPQTFVTLRRIACRINGVRAISEESATPVRGPAVDVALDDEGRPTKALEGFARSVGAAVDALKRVEYKGREHFSFMRTDPAVALKSVLAGFVEESLKAVETPRLMRWGDLDHLFVRPVRGVVMLHGSRHLPGKVMDVKASNSTWGHRLLTKKAVRLDHAANYEETLRKEGRVEPDPELRRKAIVDQLRRIEKKPDVTFLSPVGDSAAADRETRINKGLVDENAAMVEWPRVLDGKLLDRHKTLPRELFAAVIQGQQKGFFAFGAGDVVNAPVRSYAIVADMPDDVPDDVPDGGNVTLGNKRVIEARLDDAKFFFERDHETPLAEFDRLLESTTYHNKLGSQKERADRIVRLAAKLAAKRDGELAPSLNADREIVEQAAVHALRDLATQTVGEFPELQGRVIRYLLPGNERSSERGIKIEKCLSAAMARVYTPPHQPLPSDGSMSNEAVCLALAYYGEQLYYLFLAGEEPSGSKDPFGLRRCALGIVRLAVERKRRFSLRELFQLASCASASAAGDDGTAAKCSDFVRERARHYPGLFEIDGVHCGWLANAVLGGDADVLALLRAKVAAIVRFAADPAAPAIVEANKRIKNIFRKSNLDIDQAAEKIDRRLCTLPEEKELLRLIDEFDAPKESSSDEDVVAKELAQIAKLSAPLDAFFANVMVNDPDDSLRTNRFALLAAIDGHLRKTADFSCIELDGKRG